MKRLFTFLFVVFCFQGLAQSKKSKQPNIIWITCEDISPYIGIYGASQVRTPNIDQLAREGVKYTRVYTTAGVCAPSRSAIITGMYQTSIGTHHMRTIGDPKYQPVPSYSAVIPAYVKCFPEFLRKQGYYCTNNEKQDYQFETPVTVWDESSSAASHSNRGAGQPFFAVYNFFVTHESQQFARKDTLLVDPTFIEVPPLYPNTDNARKDLARMYANIERMDQQVGELLDRLKKEGEYENTYIFFFSDHGGVLPWMKREILERGTHIPFLLKFPGGEHAWTVNDNLISAVDLAPTVLSLAKVKVPTYMQGQAFLGKQKSKQKRNYVFAARDRMDTEYDRVRMVRDTAFRYVYNFMPEKINYQAIEFRLGIPMMNDILKYKEEGKLTTAQMNWFKSKPLEELYHVKSDPYEFKNLGTDILFADKLNELRAELKRWIAEVGDMAEVPEKDMIKQMWNGQDSVPHTEKALVAVRGKSITLSCNTEGASIGYQLLKQGEKDVIAMHEIKTWDFGLVYGNRNGTKVPAPKTWKVYNGEKIQMQKGDRLIVNTMRIGYKPATTKFEME
jgi:N-sulfoglucosamine sulfohydrolase